MHNQQCWNKPWPVRLLGWSFLFACVRAKKTLCLKVNHSENRSFASSQFDTCWEDSPSACLSVCLTWHVSPCPINRTVRNTSLVFSLYFTVYVLVKWSFFSSCPYHIFHLVSVFTETTDTKCFVWGASVNEFKTNHDTLAMTDKCPIKIIIKLIINDLQLGQGLTVCFYVFTAVERSAASIRRLQRRRCVLMLKLYLDSASS